MTMTTTTDSAADPVNNPQHYSWIGDRLSLARVREVRSIESWDILDALFPDDPLLWNAGKYLTRQGRKGGEEKRLEDLRKARAYLDRRISQLDN